MTSPVAAAYFALARAAWSPVRRRVEAEDRRVPASSRVSRRAGSSSSRCRLREEWPARIEGPEFAEFTAEGR
jgi:hypothetical protein